MQFERVTDPQACKMLWKKFSPHTTLWDDWEYCSCFFFPEAEQLRFMVGFDKDKPVGVLPLVYWKKEETYCFFGGTFPEQRTFFVKDKELVHKFLKRCPKNTYLEDISSSESRNNTFKKGSYRYFLMPKKYNYNFETYLKTFSKKHRKNLKYDLRQVQKLNCTIKINNIEDYYRLVELNLQQFGKKSNFIDEETVMGLRKLVGVAKRRKQLHMMSVIINDIVEAVDIGLHYNNRYYVIASGRNKNIQNIGKLLITEHIKVGMQRKVDEIDFMTSASKWKVLWNFDRERLLNFAKWEL